MKKFLPYILALFALAIGALVLTGAVALPDGVTVAKVALVAVLALQVVPMCSHNLGVIDTTLVANTIQPQYSKKLLDHAIPETRLIDYAQLEELPANVGSTSVRFFRPPSADLSAVGAPAQLVEGVAPVADRDLSFTPVDATLIQIGQKGRVTDVATNVGLLKYLDSVVGLYGEEFSLDVDTRLRNMITHPVSGFWKRYAQGLTTFAATAGAALADAVMVPRDFLDGATRLKLNRAPKIQGHYVAVTPPQGSRDIMNNADWKEVVRYQYADKIFKGEIGDLFGLRIVEGTNPMQEDEVEGTFASVFNPGGVNTTGLIYSTVITGKGGYGTVNMKKMGASPHKPQMIIITGADKADPLNQYTSVGWKAMWTGIMLNTAWGITLRHKTQFAG